MRFNKTIISSVAGASVVLTFLGLFSKGVGFIREIIYANKFGLSREFDLFLTSIAFPIVINTAVIYLCQHYFIPAYNKIKKKSEEESEFFFNYTFWWFLFGGVTIAFLFLISGNFILNFYLSSVSNELKQKGLKIFLLFLITLPLNSGMAVITAYLQANFKFVFPAVSQIFLNVIVILFIILFSEWLDIFVLPLSFSIAYFLAFILLYYPLKEKLKFKLKNLFNYRYTPSDVNVLLFLIFIEVLSLSYILIDRYFIGEVPEGGIAALNYAIVIYLLPVTIFSIPLITTMFSKFSKLALHSAETLKNDFSNALKMNAFILIPFSFLLFFNGDFILYIFYEGGEFTSGDTAITHAALQYYTISLFFYSSYLVSVKLLYSLNKYSTVLILSASAFLLKILFNFLLVDILKQNGLALSTSLIYLFLFISGVYLSIRKMGSKGGLPLLGTIVYFVLNGIFSYFIAYLLLDQIVTTGITFVIFQILIFIALYVINSGFLKDDESFIIKRTVFNFFPGIKGTDN